MLPAYVRDGRKLRLAVQRAELRGMRDIYHAGLHHVIVGGVLIKCHETGAQRLRGELAVLRGQGQYLVSGALHGSGLMRADVSAGHGDDALVFTQV